MSYNNAYPKLLYKCKEISKDSNIHVLENESITISDVTFHCATLWTDFELFGNTGIAKFECEQNMSDYHCIRTEPHYSKLRADHTKVLHHATRKWLRQSLKESNTDRNIVVTHHAPSMSSVDPKYKESLLTTGFASNLDDFIHEHQPNLWIHGYVHNCVDYSINKTRVVCNPGGYIHEWNNGFNEQMIIDI